MNSAANVFLYLIGLVMFGILYWLLDGILSIIIATNVADTTTYACWTFMYYIWHGIVIVYTIFGGIWLVRSFKASSTGGL